MTNIDFFKQDVSLGDSVTIELTSGKSVSGKVIEISECVIIEKEDGKHMRLLDGIIGGWEIIPQQLSESDVNSIFDDTVHSTNDNVVSNNSQDNDESTEDDSDNEDDDDEGFIEERAFISEIAANNFNGYSISSIKDEIRTAFKEILNKANIDELTCTPTNAEVTNSDTLRIFATLDNGNTIRFTRSTMVGFNLIRDNLLGSRFFSTSTGVSTSTIKSKRNIACMSYGQLTVVFLNALEQINYSMMRRIVRTMMNFPELTFYTSDFKTLESSLLRLKTLRSIQLCEISLTELQKKEVQSFISSLLNEQPEFSNNAGTIRLMILKDLGVKISKAYISYIISKNSSISFSSQLAKTLPQQPLGKQGDRPEKDTNSQQIVQQSISEIQSEALFKYMQMIKASSLKPNMNVLTNATYSGQSKYPTDIGQAMLDEGGMVYVRKVGFVGDISNHLQTGSRIYVHPRSSTGDSVTSIGLMTFNELNQRYAASIKTSSYWEAMSILTYMLHSVPELDNDKDTIRQILTKLSFLTQDRYAHIPTESPTLEELEWLETFVNYLINNEKQSDPYTDEQIRDLFLRRFDILLPVEFIASTREKLGIQESNLRKEKHEEQQKERRAAATALNNERVFQDLCNVLETLSINLDSKIPTNAILQQSSVGSGIKAITDDGRELSIHAEYFIGNPVSLLTGGIKLFTKPQDSGHCYITIEEMSYKELLDYCHDRLNNSKYQEIINVVKALRSIPDFKEADDALKMIYNDAKKSIKKEINQSIKSYEDLSEEEKNVITTFIKETINNEEPQNPVTDFQIVSSYNTKFGVLLHTSIISTIRGDLNIPPSVERKIGASPIYIESNCLIDKYFAWYNNGAARNSSYPEIRFKDDVVDPVLLTELKNYRKGDPPIAAVCGIITDGRYTYASFLVHPGYSDELYQTAKYFEAAGNNSIANAIKNHIEQNAVKLSPTKEATSQVKYTKARELRKSHDYIGAETILMELVSSKYQLDTVVKDLADMYREMGYVQKALDLMETYVEDMENKQKAYNFISNLYTAVGDYEHSVSFLKKAYSLIDSVDKDLRVRSLINIANQSILLKDTAGAKEVLNQALKIKYNPKAKELLEKLNKEKKSEIGELTRVLSFKAPAFLENDLRLSNYQELSEEAAKYLLRSKQYQDNQDLVKCQKSLLSYAKIRYKDLLMSDKASSAQEYMLAAQAINNTVVDSAGMLLLLSQIISDPIELAEKIIVGDFPTFLASYTPSVSCERVFYAFIRSFAENTTPTVLNDIYNNETWRNWVFGLIGHELSEKRLFRETVLKKAEQFESPYNKICNALSEVKQLDNSYDMSKIVVGLFATDYSRCLNNEDSSALAELSELIQQLNDIQKLDDYQIVEERTSVLKKQIKTLTNRYNSEPTRLTVLYMVPVLEKCQYLADDNITKLGKEKAPDLNIIASSNARIYENNCSIQFKISNKIGCSKVVSASVRIVKVNGRDTAEKQYIYNLRTPLYGGDSHSFEISISSETEDKDLKVLSVLLQVIYFDKDSIDHTIQLPIETRIDDSHNFKAYKNEFLKYANGQEVVDHKMVKGRDKLIDDIADKALNDRKSYIIHGQRRSGKSTVLLHVGNKLKANKKCFVVSMSMLSLSGDDNPIVNEQSFLGDLYFEILSKISRQIKLENKAVYKEIFGHGLECDKFLSNPNAMFTNYLDKVKDVIHDELGYQDDRIILIIDEFTALYSEILAGTISDTFIRKMKELSESGSITFILSGHDVMPIFWERFPNEFGIFKKEPITSIDPTSARELVEEPVWDTESNSSRFEYDAVSRIVELSGYSPFYIQILCAEIVEYANQNHIPVITEFDVNKVINRMTSSEAKLRRGDFDNLIPVGENKLFHEKVFGLSLDDVMEFVKEIAQYNQEYVSVSSLHSVKTNSKNKVLSYLISRNVLEEHPEYGREMVKIKVSLFKEWIRKNEQ